MSSAASPIVDPSASPSIELGFPLPLYAAVNAAIAEGFQLPDVLSIEQIKSKSWAAAERAWKLRLVTNEAALASYQTELASAEDWLDREVTPLRGDVAAWLAFLDAYGAPGRPFELLRALGLGLNDVSRLKRRWDRRLKEDTSIEQRIVELRRSALAPLPSLVVKPAVLRRSRRSAGLSEEGAPGGTAPAAVVVVPSETSMAPGKLRLYSYVAIKAQLAENPGQEERVLRQLSVMDFATTDAGWRVLLAADADLARDYRRLFEMQRAKLHGARGAATSPRSAPLASPQPSRTSLAGTSMAFHIPRGSALPFASGVPTAEAVAPSPVASVPSTRALLAGTSLAVDVPHKAALPFEGEPPGATSSRTARPPDLTVEQHASLTRQIAVAPERALETLARFTLTPTEKVAADHHFALRFAQEPGLRKTWESAYYAGGTGTAIACMPDGSTPARTPAPGTAAFAAGRDVATVPTDPVLPYEVLPPGSASVKPAGAALAGTSMGFVAPLAPALPFAQGAAALPSPPATVAAAVPGVFSPLQVTQAALSGTSMNFVLSNAPVLPFAPGTRPSPPATPVPCAPVPSLTLQQYASLCAELAVFRERTEAIFQQYGLGNLRDRLTVDLWWQERLRRNPAENQGWQALYQRWVAHFQEQRQEGQDR